MARDSRDDSSAPPVLVLVTGGTRSGKSEFAETRAKELALRFGATPYYFATAEALDDEMVERIALHRTGRGSEWQTVEVPIDPAGELAKIEAGSVALLDCITLWLSNLMGSGLDDPEIMERVGLFLSACKGSGCSVYLVTNEVGSGIVPENPAARRFRDLAGRVNREVAAAADEVYLIVAGLPLTLK